MSKDLLWKTIRGKTIYGIHRNTKQVSDTQERLTAWYKETTERLGIETDEIRRKRAGFDGVIHFISGLFNDNFKYRSIEKKTAKMITERTMGKY